MCRNKKWVCMLLGMTMLLSSGCGISGLVTDTGSGKQQTIVKEDYLRTDLLEKNAGDNVNNRYQVLTLSKGTFVESALKQTMSRSYVNVPTVNYTLEGITARFGEYLVGYMDYVNKGDPIATIHTDVDEIGIEQAKISLQRLEERYALAREEYLKDLKARDEKKAITYDSFDRKIQTVEYQQRILNWENEKYYYERDIQDARDALDRLTKIGAIYKIPAPKSGYIYLTGRVSTGKELKVGDYICHILDNSDVYAITENQADRFEYGMSAQFNSRSGETPATVVNAGTKALYGNLDTGKATFLLKFDVDVSELNQTSLNNMVLKADLATVKNVIVLPTQAVTVQNGKCFVTVLNDDGSLLKTQFVPGGSNANQYWVLEGLTEGMKIVYN